MTATASSIQVDAPALGGRELISLNLNIAILLWARYTGSGDFTPDLFSWLATDRLSAAASCPIKHRRRGTRTEHWRSQRFSLRIGSTCQASDEACARKAS